MARFFLIRHAANDTIGNKFAGRMKGVSLNGTGTKQAEKLVELLNDIPLAAIYSSPLERAVQTAKPLAKSRNLVPIILDQLTEIDCGEWTGKNFDEIRSDPTFELFNTFLSGTRIPGGELVLETQARVVATLENLAAQHPDQNIAVFTHADPIKTALAHYAGIPLDFIRRLEINPASISILDLTEEDARILLLNYTGGLDLAT